MKKIPVQATIQSAYQFVFTHLGTIIGLIWLPMVVITVAGFFVMQRYYAVAADAFASGAFARLGPVLLSVFCYLIAKLLFTAVMCVPVIQLAQGQRKDGVLVHFAFGPPEWRLFRALIGLAAFLMLPAILAGGLVNVVLSGGGNLVTQGVMTGLLLLLSGMVFVGLRFVFLLPAVAVGEEGPVLPSSWKLSAGNFWRIVLILLAVLGPVLALAGIAEMAVEGTQGVMPDFQTTSALAAAQLHGLSVNMPIAQGIGFVIAPLTLGLFCGASVYALAALRSGAPEV